MAWNIQYISSPQYLEQLHSGREIYAAIMKPELKQNTESIIDINRIS